MGLGSWLFGGDPKGAESGQQALDTANQYNTEIANSARQGMMGAQGRQAPLIDPNDPRYSARDSSFRQNQAQMLALAQQRAMGQNTVAEQQFRQAANRNLAQQAALAQAGRGNAAMAQRQALNNQANVNATLAGDASMAASQEANQYAGLAGQLAGQARGQDIGLNQFNAQQALGLAGQNQQAALNQGYYNDMYQAQMMGQLGGAGQRGFENQQQYNQWLAANQSGGVFGDLLGAGLGIGSQYLTSQIGGQAVGGGGGVPMAGQYIPPSKYR